MNLIDSFFCLRFVPVKFGVDATSEIGYDIEEFNAKKAFVVTDKFLHENSKIVDNSVKYVKQVDIGWTL